jgi:hypothetical protein
MENRLPNELNKLVRRMLKDIYNEIDCECISETSNVSMSSVKKVLVEYGANPEDLD